MQLKQLKKKAGLLNVFFLEYEIKNKPQHTIKIPINPSKLIVDVKNNILIIAINNDEPPLAIG